MLLPAPVILHFPVAFYVLACFWKAVSEAENKYASRCCHMWTWHKAPTVIQMTMGHYEAAPKAATVTYCSSILDPLLLGRPTVHETHLVSNSVKHTGTDQPESPIWRRRNGTHCDEVRLLFMFRGSACDKGLITSLDWRMHGPHVMRFVNYYVGRVQVAYSLSTY